MLIRPKLFLSSVLLMSGCEPVNDRDSAEMAETSVVVSDSTIDTVQTTTDSTVAPGITVFITELMADNGSTVADGYGEYHDWIEIYNPGPNTVDLDGFGLSDVPSDPYLGMMEQQQMIPGEYLLFFASGKDEVDALGYRHLPFSLSKEGETVTLTDPGGVMVHSFEFEQQVEDVSIGLSQQTTAEELVGKGSVGSYALNPAKDWTATDFDDDDWTTATLPVGFNQDGSGTVYDNVALFGHASQSSDGYGLTGAQGTDGDMATFSHTNDADMEPWWQVDLGGEYKVQSVHMYNRLDCCQDRLYNITVTLLDQEGDAVWESEVVNAVEPAETPTSPGSVLHIEVEEGLLTAGVRVSKTAVNGASSSEWLSLAEVDVMAISADEVVGFETDLAGAMYGISDVVSLRFPFASVAADRLTLDLNYDDGVIVWVSGQEVFSDNASSHSLISAHDPNETVSVTIPRELSNREQAVLALLGRNLDLNDDDFLLDAKLTAFWIETGDVAWFTDPTPGAPNGEGSLGYAGAPEFDPPRGFFESGAEVTISSNTAGATIYYTIDGSWPGADNGVAIEATSSASTPSDTVTVSSTSMLRAVAVAEEYEDSTTETHSYLFLDQVIEQPQLPEGFADTWDGISQSAISADYEMDPEVVDDPAYTDDLLSGLREIPTLSIVMDYADLFGDGTGIYVNSEQRGSSWERPGSVELIEPDGKSGFQEDCGVRIHGYGWRAHSNTLKHSLRLEFRGEYGKKKLDYPLFQDAPVDRFDSIVLRSQGSRGWQDFRNPEQAQYIRDAFARDTAREMGKVDGHAAYVHLYLNGLYWGLYMAVERPDAGFGEEYFGGSDSEYDAINRRTSTNEAIDGDLDAYNTLLALVDEEPRDDMWLAEVEGLLDIEDLIDYMLIHQYTVNQDGPCCFDSNNMRAVRRRLPEEQFRFFVWDMEYSIWDANDDTNINIDVPGSVSHVYSRLRENTTFRERFATRAREHLEAGGALSVDGATDRWEARAAEIYNAVVAESARWGDTDRAVPYTRDVEWQQEHTRLLNSFFPYRTDYMKSQLEAEGLY